jgi:alkaline phosphatase D
MLALVAVGLTPVHAAEPRGVETAWLPLPSSDAVLERIAFGSCARQKNPQPIWDAVVAAKPQLFLMMGDNVYGDTKSGELTKLAPAYAMLAAHPDFAKARAAIPFYAIWDDHDFGLNDGDGMFEHKAEAQKLFNRFWSVTGERASREGVYDAAILGPPGKRVQIILLDTRYFRSPLERKSAGTRGPGKYAPSADSGKTLLGPAQWSWLEAQLRQPAELRLVVSSIQILAENHAFERWGHLPHERERLLKLIGATGAKGVVFLSGDRHFGVLYRRTDGVPYPLVEVTSSSLNGPLSPVFSMLDGEVGVLGEGSYRGENFGMATIDWQGRALSLALHDLEGKPVRSVRIPFGDLGIK